MTSSSNNGGFSLEGTCTGPEPSQHSQDAIARHPNNFSRDLISWKGNERRLRSEKERERELESIAWLRDLTLSERGERWR